MRQLEEGQGEEGQGETGGERSGEQEAKKEEEEQKKEAEGTEAGAEKAAKAAEIEKRLAALKQQRIRRAEHLRQLRRAALGDARRDHARRHHPRQSAGQHNDRRPRHEQ